MKRILLLIVVILSWLMMQLDFSYADDPCTTALKTKLANEYSVKELLNKKECQPTTLVWSQDDKGYDVEGGLKTILEKNIITNLMALLWVVAIWSIVFWWFMMTISAWEEEKIKKAKDIIKWGIIGFLWVIGAWWIATIIINFMFFLWEKST